MASVESRNKQEQRVKKKKTKTPRKSKNWGRNEEGMLNLVRRVQSGGGRIEQQQREIEPLQKRSKSSSKIPPDVATESNHNSDNHNNHNKRNKHNKINRDRLSRALSHFEHRYPGEVITTRRTFETALLPTLSLSLLSVPSLSFASFREVLLSLSSLPSREIQLFFEKLSVLVSKHFRRGAGHLKRKGFPKGEEKDQDKEGEGKRRKERKEKGKWTDEEVIVLYLSTLKYVHIVRGLDTRYLEKNYGNFHFSLCVNVLAALIPELRT